VLSFHDGIPPEEFCYYTRAGFYWFQNVWEEYQPQIKAEKRRSRKRTKGGLLSLYLDLRFSAFICGSNYRQNLGGII